MGGGVHVATVNGGGVPFLADTGREVLDVAEPGDFTPLFIRATNAGATDHDASLVRRR